MQIYALFAFTCTFDTTVIAFDIRLLLKYIPYDWCSNTQHNIFTFMTQGRSEHSYITLVQSLLKNADHSYCTLYIIIFFFIMSN